MTQFDQLIAKLSDLFELEKADLDFGLHRIIKPKHKQITDYLTKRLPEKVAQVLGEIAQAEAAGNLAELKQAIRDNIAADAIADDGTLADQYANTKLGKQYLDALKASTDAKAAEQTEAEVYSHLYEFFSRYYEDGDFISRRRRTAGKETYAIPYDGQEVVLHWANKDQYYIKSSEDLKDYTFTVPLNPSGDKGRVQFKLTRMDAIQNNNKATRIFVLDEEAEIEATDDTLVVPFHFAEAKKRTKPEEAEWEQSVLEALPSDWQIRLSAPDSTYTGDDKDGRTVLQKHLRNYTKKNTSDYFIHKDLGGFLRRELDFYIKNEVMHLDDVDRRPADYLEKELRKIKAVRQVAHDLIDFLAQFEDFQKKLWLKKKFVIETHWCITLDRVPEDLYHDIAANEKQRQEWVKLFAINEIKADKLGSVAYSEPLTVEFLKANDKLLVDTAFFSSDFKYRLLGRMTGGEDIDSHTDGLLVHSENFQALNLLQERYRGQAKCIYIDPPYNAKSSEILYKNTYKHASWLSLMHDRLALGASLMRDDCIHVVAIDEVEQEVLGQIVSMVFPEHVKACVPAMHNPRGQQGKNISYVHEFAYFIYPGDDRKYIADTPKDEVDSRNLRDSGTESDREDAKTCFYPFFVKDGEITGVGEVPPDDYHPTSANVERDDGVVEVWPLDESGDEKKWRYSVNTIHAIWDKLEPKNGRSSLQIIFNKDIGTMRSLWAGAKFDASEYGTKVLQGMLGKHATELFSYPKSIHTMTETLKSATYEEPQPLVVDYFAGSATTAHSLIELSRDDLVKPTYVLAEMGEYFELVTRPRTLKAIYSAKWEEAKPASRDTGISHCFKYIRLESYEDALNNLELEDRSADLLGMPENVAEDYLLRYALDVETRASLLNLERFEDPFNSMLRVYNRRTGEAEPTPVDLPETFNYLLGLRVRTMQMRDGFLVIEGENPGAETVLVIWRNVKEKDNEALAAFVAKTLRINPADTEYAAIYINGDTTLDDPHKKVLLIEQAFHELMFDVRGL